MICKFCGFETAIPLKAVLLDDNILSFAIYLEMLCEECGHIKDGSTMEKIK